MPEKVIEVAADGQLLDILSPSRAKEFETCQLQWWFSSAQGWRTPPTRHTTLGIVVHSAFEELFKAEPEERTQGLGLDLLTASWAEAKANPANEMIVSDVELMAELEVEAREALLGLWALERPHRVEVTPEQNEAWVEATFGEARVGGKIDRYTDNGVLRITDYKTGKIPQPAYVESYLYGLWTYAVVMLANNPELRPEVELLYVRHGVRIRRPVLIPYARNHALRLRNVWREQRRVTSEHAITARTSVLCNWCAFEKACPLRKGSKTPTPGSVDSDGVLLDLGLTRREPKQQEPTVEELLDEVPGDLEMTEELL